MVSVEHANSAKSDFERVLSFFERFLWKIVSIVLVCSAPKAVDFEF